MKDFPQNPGPGHWMAVTAVLALLAASASALAQDGSARMYGRIDLSLDNTRTGVNSNVGYGVPGARTLRMTDNTSRLGIVGSEDLGDGMRALYGLEFGINADDGSLVTPNFRFSYVGLSGSFGTFNLGRLDAGAPTGSPLYSQLFQNIRSIIHDAGVTAIGTRVLNANNRVSNALTYKTPDFSGFNFVTRVNLAGPDGVTTTTNANLKSEGDFKQYQFALNYAGGKLNGGLGYAFDEKAGGFVTNDFKKKRQATLSYSFDAIKPYAVWGQDRYNNTATSRETVNYWLVGATVPLGQHRVTANYMARGVQTDRAGTLKKFQAEYSYFLSKRSTLYVYLDRDTTNTNKPDSLANTLGVGIMHNF